MSVSYKLDPAGLDSLSWWGLCILRKDMKHTSGSLHMLCSLFRWCFLHITCLSLVTAYSLFWPQCKFPYPSWPPPPCLAWSPTMHSHDALHFSFQPYLFKCLSSPLDSGPEEGRNVSVLDSARSKAWQIVKAELHFCWKVNKWIPIVIHLKKCLYNQQSYAILLFKLDKLKSELQPLVLARI